MVILAPPSDLIPPAALSSSMAMSWAYLFCCPTEADGPESGRIFPPLTTFGCARAGRSARNAMEHTNAKANTQTYTFHPILLSFIVSSFPLPINGNTTRPLTPLFHFNSCFSLLLIHFQI